MNIRIDKNELADKLFACVNECLEYESLLIRDKTASSNEILLSLLKDCADTCSFTAALVKRESEYTERMLKLCEEICYECAVELEIMKISKIETIRLREHAEYFGHKAMRSATFF